MKTSKDFQLELESRSATCSYHPFYAVVLGGVENAVLFEYLLSVAAGREEFAVKEVDVRAATGLDASALHVARTALIDKAMIGFSVVKNKPTYAIYAAIFDAFLEGTFRKGREALEAVAKVEPEATAAPEAPQSISIGALFDALVDDVVTDEHFAVPGGLVPVKISAQVDPDTSCYYLGVALCKVCGIDEKLNIGKAIGLAKRLLMAELKPTLHLIEFQYSDPRGWWRNVDFRGRKAQAPSLWQIENTWGSWGGAFAPPEEIDVSAEALTLMGYGAPGLPNLP